MSNIALPKPAVTGSRRIALAALLALLAAAAVALVLTLSDNSSSTVADQPQSALRADGGPEETAVAAAVGSSPSVAPPDESKIAATLGRAEPATRSTPSSRPDESAVAAAISGR
jgi:hypothetical protein